MYARNLNVVRSATFMSETKQHEMQLEMTHPSGAQEWCCPVCGRRIVVRWQPKFEMMELEAGDGSVGHYGSTSKDLKIGQPQVGETDEPVLSDELRAALDEALENIDLDNWLDEHD
jgi:hypothetical protein